MGKDRQIYKSAMEDRLKKPPDGYSKDDITPQKRLDKQIKQKQQEIQVLETFIRENGRRALGKGRTARGRGVYNREDSPISSFPDKLRNARADFVALKLRRSLQNNVDVPRIHSVMIDVNTGEPFEIKTAEQLKKVFDQPRKYQIVDNGVFKEVDQYYVDSRRSELENYITGKELAENPPRNFDAELQELQKKADDLKTKRRQTDQKANDLKNVKKLESAYKERVEFKRIYDARQETIAARKKGANIVPSAEGNQLYQEHKHKLELALQLANDELKVRETIGGRTASKKIGEYPEFVLVNEVYGEKGAKVYENWARNKKAQEDYLDFISSDSQQKKFVCAICDGKTVKQAVSAQQKIIDEVNTKIKEKTATQDDKARKAKAEYMRDQIAGQLEARKETLRIGSVKASEGRSTFELQKDLENIKLEKEKNALREEIKTLETL